MIERCVRDFRNGKDITHLLRGIIALACPDSDGNLAESVLRTMEQDAENNGYTNHFSYSYNSETDSRGCHPRRRQENRNVNADFSSVHASDANAEKLINKLGIDRERALRVPEELRAALVHVLESSPTCCISMDDLVDASTGKIVPGTVVLFEKVGGNPHAYMFSKAMLDEWFSSSGGNTNPLTRDNIDLARQYFQLS